MESGQCLEVNIRLVHHIECEWFGCKIVEFITIMPFSISNVDIGRNASSQIKQCVHLDCAFAVFTQCPRCKFYAGGYCCGVQCINHIVNAYI